MKSHFARVPIIAGVGMTCVLAACDASQPGDGPAPPTPMEVTLLDPQPASAGRIAYVMALRDSSAPGVNPTIGSFRFAIHYDTSVMEFERMTGSDILLTAANKVGGRVLVAGASANGFAAGGWFALEFTPRNAGVTPESPTIEVMDLGDLNGVDIRQRIAARPAWIPK